jgi:DNA-binding transcriptional ArsR family regulator
MLTNSPNRLTRTHRRAAGAGNRRALRDPGEVAQLDAVFGALSDPTRRAIIERLGDGEATVTQLAEPFGMSLPAIARHVRVLEHAGLLTSHKRGRERRCSRVEPALRDAVEWIIRYGTFWEAQLDSLETLIASVRDEEAR